MGHIIEAAVDFWNRKGYLYGEKSDVMRPFMRRAANYKLQHKSENRSDGAKMAQDGSTYRKPENPPLPVPPNIDWDDF